MNEEEIINNYLNGNISDFKRQIKRLTKKEILMLIHQWTESTNELTEKEIIGVIYSYL